MCGIVAIVGLPPSAERTELIRRMAASIEHRGPDSDGFFEAENVAFGFRRLAILDLSPAGNQPMSTADGNVSIIFNGEIYNFIELRAELESLGHVFHSSGDTEVLLHAYLEWGQECVKRLNGMWAFMIYDRRTGKVYGSRDRFGIKPMFVARNGGCWVFGSEIKALFASGLVKRDPDWRNVADLVITGRLDRGEATFFAGVQRVAAATWFEIDAAGRYREHQFWSPPTETSPEAILDAPERFAELFEDSMRLHQRSDVPLAVHLSGGLDSTSIICALRRVQSTSTAPLAAYSFMHDSFDERAFIGDTIAMTRATLKPVVPKAQALWESLTPALIANDEPVHSMTALVSYALMERTAADGIRVVLNGQGADETLAGYSSYFGTMWRELIGNLQLREALDQIRRYAAGHRRDAATLVATQLNLSLRGGLRRWGWYRRLAESRRRRPGIRWASPELAALVSRPPASGRYASLKEDLKYSIEQDPLPIYLRIEDRNAMAHSVESRVPFLDYRLVEMAMQLASTELLDGPWNKWLLRRAMKGRIPEAIRTRVDKMGFPVPDAQWLRGPLWSAVEPVLRDDIVRRSGLFDVARIDRDLVRFRNGADDAGADVFHAAQFAIWWHSVVKSTDTTSVLSKRTLQ